MTEPGWLRRYLLGDVDESEMEAFEKELVVSDEPFQELAIEEDELIDDYWAGRLDESEVRKYREHFLVTPERLRQHRLGGALREHVAAAAARDTAAPTPEPTPRRLFARTWLQLVAAAVAFALVGTGIGWLILSPVRIEPRARDAESSSVAFFLTGANLRSLPSATDQAITVPARVDFVELQLDLSDDSALATAAGAEHRVTLVNARTDAVLAEGTLTAQIIDGQSVVVAPVPSRLLTPGDYRVILRPLAASAESERAEQRSYAFRVSSP